MVMLQRVAAVLPASLAVLVVSAPAAGADTLLRLTGIGPVMLGQVRSEAVDTGWLSDPGKGCELQSPVPTVYRLLGSQAPKGLRGSAEFNDGTLTSISVSKGARTSTGIRVGKTTVAGMTRAYRKRGYKVRSESSETFGGTFVTVFNRAGNPVIGGFATGGMRLTTLAIPRIQTCE